MKKEVKNSRKIVVILGPTATGKSDLAVKIAKKIGGEIISADSRQVYKGLDIGTGKITKKEMRGVSHHLLDVISPRKQFTASDFVRLSRPKIFEIFGRGHTPIICGGAGFYISTLLGEWPTPEVPPNKKLRERLSKKSVPQLFLILKKLDPKRAKTIDAKNPVRLIRAIEIAKTLGQVPPIHRNPKGTPEGNTRNTLGLFQYSQEYWNSKLLMGEMLGEMHIEKIGLDFSDKELKKRIALRLEKRLKQGMIKEARSLHARGLSWKRMERLGLEYRFLAQLLQNKISQKEFEEKLLKEIWAYAKRQRTWFRKDKNVKWFEPQEIKKILKRLKKFC